MNKVNKKYVVGIILIVTLIVISFLLMPSLKGKSSQNVEELQATVLMVNDDEVTVQDSNHIIYVFDSMGSDVSVGDNLLIEYTGLLNKNKSEQDGKVIEYTMATVALDGEDIPSDWLDNGIFSDYYTLAYNKLKELSLEEKIGQILLVRYPESGATSALEKYNFGGYVFFEKDFSGKTKEEVVSMMEGLQKVAKVPILTAVDEEGGKVVRVSSNSNLATSKFKSSSELYSQGGFDLIREDTINKSNLLKSLGINLNLAPVVDVSTNPDDYIYERTLGEGTELTSVYAKTVINASKGTDVSYTLKHFPGYGSNSDTHAGSSVDTRSYEDIVNNDLPPFEAGINAGAEAVLVSHNIVDSIDSVNPASLSSDVHNLLRNELGFTGIVITDDLAMSAVSSIDDVAVKAILAGNDLIITTDYLESINSIKEAIDSGTISEELVNKLAFRVIAWKYYKGLMFENQK